MIATYVVLINFHGGLSSSLKFILCRIDEAESTLLIIKTDKSEVLGAFCDEPWEIERKCVNVEVENISEVVSRLFGI